MNKNVDKNLYDKIPKGESCANQNGICPFWCPVVMDRNDVVRAKCKLLNYEETEDFQGTFLWGMLKICDIKNEME